MESGSGASSESDSDESGDGYIECAELQHACQRVNMPCTPEDAQRLFDFLDTSGDGLIGPDELENAIRMYRRFHWENKAIHAAKERLTFYGLQRHTLAAARASGRARVRRA